MAEQLTRPGPSMLRLLPREFVVTGSDDGRWFVLGGRGLPDVSDPDVWVTVEHAHAVGGDRDLGESMAWLVAELLAVMTGGHTAGLRLSEDERAELTSQLRLLLRAGRDAGRDA